MRKKAVRRKKVERKRRWRKKMTKKKKKKKKKKRKKTRGRNIMKRKRKGRRKVQAMKISTMTQNRIIMKSFSCILQTQYKRISLIHLFIFYLQEYNLFFGMITLWYLTRLQLLTLLCLHAEMLH